MPDSFDYTTGTNSENVRLLQALIDDAPEYTEDTNSRNANILKSIINNTEYTDAPQSEIEELLLRLKAKIGGEIEVDELNVTENGTYDAGVNKAYNPVNVELPLSSKTITENGTYTASDDNLAGFNEVTVAVEGYAKKSIANTPTPIATFNASALPMPSLSVGIEAVQDLHGYDYPWVGGAGKNKLQNTLNSSQGVTVNDDGSVVLNGTFASTVWPRIITNITLKAGTYTLSGTPQGAPEGCYIYDDDTFGGWTDRGSGSTKTFENDTTGSIMIRVPSGTYNNVKFYPMIEIGSTKTDFAPYENIRPITGWSAVDVNRTGKNMYSYNSISIYDYNFSQQIAFSQMRNPVFMKGGQKYVLSLSDNITLFRMRAFDKSQNLVTDTSIVNAHNQGSGRGLVFYSNGNFFGYDGAGVNSITTFQPTEDIWFDMTVQTTSPSQVMFERGETPSTYEAYNGTTYTTTLKDGQGNPLTCYGGELTNENGVQSLENTDGYAVFDGSSDENWIAISQGFYIEVSTMESGAYKNGLSNWLKTAHSYDEESDMSITFGTQYQVIKVNHIKDNISDITDVASWKTYLASHNLTVKYPLATPTTIPQDNLAISSQDGTNNLWADSGDVLSGEYFEAL